MIPEIIQSNLELTIHLKVPLGPKIDSAIIIWANKFALMKIFIGFHIWKLVSAWSKTSICSKNLIITKNFDKFVVIWLSTNISN